MAVAAGAVMIAMGSDRDAPLAPAIPVSPHRLPGRGPYTSVVATASGVSVDVYATRDGRVPIREIENPTASGSPAVFLVTDESDAERLSVLLPIRPNGSQGWIPRDQVAIGTTDYRVRVRVGTHVLEAYNGEELVLRAPIAVGKADTPTPGGRFFIKDLVEPPHPDSIYGTHAFGLSGFSNTLREFNGGAGVVGIHGTNDPNSIGKDVSSGCIRLRNEDVTNLVGRLPLGTPVEILS
ncbi:MAG: L,D-transpeptidase [Actinobacteria bacterium]|nr:L,D-transpeptidase [Actinomycetota bacterium]